MLKLTKLQLMTMRLFQMFGIAVWFCFLKICINYFKHKNKFKKTLTVSMVVSYLYQNYYYSVSLKGVTLKRIIARSPYLGALLPLGQLGWESLEKRKNVEQNFCRFMSNLA